MKNLFKHRDQVTLFFREQEITDARIVVVEKDGERRIFLCSNFAQGFVTEDRLGYAFSYELSPQRPLSNDTISKMAILGRKPTYDEVKFLETSYDNDNPYNKHENLNSKLN